MIQFTSVLALEEIKPSLGQRQREVYEVIRKFRDITNLEIATYLNLPINSITPRVNELRKKGLVVESRKKPCSVSGRLAIAWKLKSDDKLF